MSNIGTTSNATQINNSSNDNNFTLNNAQTPSSRSRTVSLLPTNSVEAAGNSTTNATKQSHNHETNGEFIFYFLLYLYYCCNYIHSHKSMCSIDADEMMICVKCKQSKSHELTELV